MTLKRTHATGVPSNPSSSPSAQQQQTQTYKSSPIHDRKSTFIALFSNSPGHVANPRLLQQVPEFADAMHRILAYRRPSKQRSLNLSSASQQQKPVIYETYFDDDGEKYAGKRLEKVLNEMNVQGGVVVVARWYGGILLGPVRFNHVEDCARQAIRMCFSMNADGGDTDDHGGQSSKRAKLDKEQGGNENDPRSKEKLIKVLTERDESVNVLRGLLSEKNGLLTELKTKVNSGGKNDASGSINEDAEKKVSSVSEQVNSDDAVAVQQPAPKVSSLSTISATLSKDDDMVTKDQAASSESQATTAPSSSTETITESAATATLSSPTMSHLTPNLAQDSDKHNSTASKQQRMYSNLTFSRLKQLEKARDATLSWILKQIDAVEVNIKDLERNIGQKKMEGADLESQIGVNK